MVKRGQAVRRRPVKGHKASTVRKQAPTEVDAKRENLSFTRELAEAREQQAATSELLKVIGRSTFDLQPVFETLAENAVKLCEAERSFIFRFDGQYLRVVATHNTSAEIRAFVERNPIAPGRASATARAALEQRTVHVLDAQTDPEYTYGSRQVEPFRTILTVPMLKAGEMLGVILVYRLDVRPFTDSQIALLETFADQAVIAIENVRLSDEVQAKTHDLTESLEQQTSMGEILRVISSSAMDIQPVFETIASNSVNLCGAAYGVVYRFDGEVISIAAHHNVDPTALDAFHQIWPMRPNANALIGRAILERKALYVLDVAAEPGYTFAATHQEALGLRTFLSVPMLRDGNPIGAIAVYRKEVKPFSNRQIELVKAFADQAVIAVENVRLFDELQARTEDLRESLQQQTATADVLKVISRSTLDVERDLESVLETLLESAIRLCGATRGHVYRYDGEFLRFAAAHGAWPGFRAYLEENPLRPGRGSIAGRAALELRVCHVPDVLSDTEYEQRELLTHQSFRSALCVPMLREGVLIGVIAILKEKVEPFTDKQIELVSTFADQAVIAIENVRLFDEVQARTDDLRESLQQRTATADVLKVISRSTFDLKTVLQTLVESATRLCDVDKATITRQKDGVFFRAEAYGFSDEFMDYARTVPVVPDRGSAIGRALLEKVPVHIHDVEADADFTFTEGKRLGGFRTILGVPMLREGVPVGVITMTRSEPRPFTDKQIELATTFADQAAIAIENVRLFDEVQERTQELSKSLEELRTAQDRLVQTEKLASLGQLTAGIAHEIKNPLNFVNNFSALSVELVDELDDVLKPATLDNKTRAETDELTHMLKGNLEKVMQHGKRADLIVKNMLLHSREGSTERRSINLNRLVEESLNLAYHGARAENQDFKINLEQSLDSTVGKVDLFPQEITRVLINLISNGFYAATRRKAESKLNGYEPILAAATRNLGDRVEIRIRDNGGGIPPEVKEKIFNPFFTTKPPGQGTGLGLSLSYDIVVKQHSGSIEVDTQPGEFTEFKVILPR
jgi:two-component system, NtrC family, sensor kinase